MSDFDLFLSHASEDKAAFVLPLAAELDRRGFSVWLDRQQLTVGDSLSEKIDEGLSRAQFGVVVLSHAFFAKRWPRRELDGLVTRETVSGAKVILPVWHGLTAEDVLRYSPPLAGKLAANTDDGVSAVADRIEEALNAVTDTPAQPGSADSAGSRGVGRRVTMKADLGFQGAMGIRRAPSPVIHWSPSLHVSYTGGEIVAISDIVPSPPPRIAIMGDEDTDRTVQLRRVRNSNHFDLFPTFGDLAGAQQTLNDGTLKHAVQWPLLLKPGDSCHITLHQEYEFFVDSSPFTFTSERQVLEMLGGYFDLDRTDDGGFKLGVRLLPTRIKSDLGEWEMDVSYGTYVVGGQFEVPEGAFDELPAKARKFRLWKPRNTGPRRS